MDTQAEKPPMVAVPRAPRKRRSFEERASLLERDIRKLSADAAFALGVKLQKVAPRTMELILQGATETANQEAREGGGAVLPFGRSKDAGGAGDS